MPGGGPVRGTSEGFVPVQPRIGPGNGRCGECLGVKEAAKAYRKTAQNCRGVRKPHAIGVLFGIHGYRAVSPRGIGSLCSRAPQCPSRQPGPPRIGGSCGVENSKSTNVAGNPRTGLPPGPGRPPSVPAIKTRDRRARPFSKDRSWLSFLEGHG